MKCRAGEGSGDLNSHDLGVWPDECDACADYNAGWGDAVAECVRLVSARAIAVPRSYAVTIDTLGDVERDICALKHPDRAKEKP